MKHIGWCLDQIQIALGDIPKHVDTPEDKQRAERIISKVEWYAKTLEKLITNPSLRSYLTRLEKTPIELEGVKLRAHEATELLMAS